MPHMSKGAIFVATRPIETPYTTIAAGERLLVDDIDPETDLADCTILEKLHPELCGHNTICIPADTPGVKREGNRSFNRFITLVAVAALCLVAVAINDASTNATTASVSPPNCYPPTVLTPYFNIF